MARNLPQSRMASWWKPVAGIAVAAGVAMVAILVFQNQQGVRDSADIAKAAADVAQSKDATQVVDTAKPAAPRVNNDSAAIGYTVPPASGAEAPLTRAQLASYVFAHSEYSSLPGRRNVVSDAAIEDDAANSQLNEASKP
jgi:hypothetical protein